jgi:hypothetical protein
MWFLFLAIVKQSSFFLDTWLCNKELLVSSGDNEKLLKKTCFLQDLDLWRSQKLKTWNAKDRKHFLKQRPFIFIKICRITEL